MSLRDLVVSIAFDMDSSPLDSVNSQINDFASNIGDSASGLDDLSSNTETATSGVGDLGNTLGETGAEGSEAVNDVNDAMDDLGGKSDETSNLLVDNWGKITLASATAGAGIEAMGRQQAELTEQTNQLAMATGYSSDEIRNAAQEISNVTFPIEDALDLMETGRQQGLESVEALQEYAATWDTIGDATGLSGPALAEAGVALRQLGIAAGEEEQAMAAFGYITQETTSDVGEFMDFVGRMGSDLNDLGMDINDTAAVLGILENEMGMTGRVARTELNSAIKEADGDMSVLLETLGISNDTFNEYTDAVAGSADVIQDYADNHAESYTFMQKFQHQLSELTYAYGPLIQAMTALVPILFILGPAIKAVAAAKVIFNAALWASPVTWVVAGIVALVAIIWVLWRNWDTVSAWLMDSWEWLKETAITVFGAVRDWLIEVFTAIGLFIVETWNSIKEWTVETWNGMVETIFLALTTAWEWIVTIWTAALEFYTMILTAIWEFVSQTFMNIFNTIVEWLTMAYNTIMEIWNNVSSFVSEILNTIWATIISMFTNFFNSISEWMNNAYDKIVEVWNNAQSFLEGINLYQIGVDIIQGLVDGIAGMAQNVWNAVTDIADGISSRFKSALSIFSPSRLFKEFGIDTMMGYQIGFEDQAQHVHSLVDDTARGIGDNFEPDVSSDYSYTPEHAPVSNSSHNEVTFHNTFDIHVEGNVDETSLERLEAKMREISNYMFPKQMEIYNKRMKAKYGQ
ncbi:phage tail tape measure protein [Alkalihalophilus marmarensis]|uniref:phage tail protein n=1 Tax=Alkalihalophilus marmarensis TaxID=521377 RepID=UPI00204094DB|nr:phage tail tape measure protein [Alkalihalophilus marmarensis]MCM3488776.1 phage tail tape measure protein [Alkalihalophilus marmarensis]